ncbi:MAG: hypothetical protein KAR06_03305 [Deltaproteobacteria bacterium]|nr:hypothetical protein [Deltaproteobacteria bacterium]
MKIKVLGFVIKIRRWYDRPKELQKAPRDTLWICDTPVNKRYRIEEDDR